MFAARLFSRLRTTGKESKESKAAKERGGLAFDYEKLSIQYNQDKAALTKVRKELDELCKADERTQLLIILTACAAAHEGSPQSLIVDFLVILCVLAVVNHYQKGPTNRRNAINLKIKELVNTEQDLVKTTSDLFLKLNDPRFDRIIESLNENNYPIASRFAV